MFRQILIIDRYMHICMETLQEKKIGDWILKIFFELLLGSFKIIFLKLILTVHIFF